MSVAQARSYPFVHAFESARYPPGYLRLGVSEAQVQTAVIAALQVRRALVFPVDAGARMLRGRAVGALRRAGARHPEALLAGRTGAGVRGLADLIGILPGGRALFVEVKAPAWMVGSPATGRLVQKRAAGAPTDEQLAFLAHVHRQGGVAGVVWSARDLDAILPAAWAAA